MTQPIALEARAKRDGCGCPPWVRCIHFDGQILWLGDREHVTYRAIVGRDHTEPSRFGIASGTGTYPCECGRGHIKLNGILPLEKSFDSLPEAEAEFLHRAELLLGGEVAT